MILLHIMHPRNIEDPSPWLIIEHVFLLHIYDTLVLGCFHTICFFPSRSNKLISVSSEIIADFQNYDHDL